MKLIFVRKRGRPPKGKSGSQDTGLATLRFCCDASGGLYRQQTSDLNPSFVPGFDTSGTERECYPPLTSLSQQSSRSSGSIADSYNTPTQRNAAVGGGAGRFNNNSPAESVHSVTTAAHYSQLTGGTQMNSESDHCGLDIELQDLCNSWEFTQAINSADNGYGQGNSHYVVPTLILQQSPTHVHSLTPQHQYQQSRQQHPSRDSRQDRPPPPRRVSNSMQTPPRATAFAPVHADGDRMKDSSSSGSREVPYNRLIAFADVAIAPLSADMTPPPKRERTISMPPLRHKAGAKSHSGCTPPSPDDALSTSAIDWLATEILNNSSPQDV